jgi:hypothetical protein
MFQMEGSAHSIEHFYQDIGRELISIVSAELEGKVLLYAEMQDGMGSVSIFGIRIGTTDLHMLFASNELEDLIFSFWQEWKSQPDNQEWRVMCYTIENSKFHADFIYPEQIPDSEDEVVPDDYREFQVRKHFGDVTIHSREF